MKEEMNNEELRVNSTERKRSEGITLIALVITIILLLILAVVSIQIITNQGIITHAETAGTTYTEEQEKELIGIGYSNYQLEKYVQVETTDDFESLQTYFLGENKQGIILDTLVDEKQTEENGGYITFTNGLVITEDSMSENEERGEYYFTFHQNGYIYRLTYDENGMSKNLEILGKEPTLAVEGAEVTGSASEAWDVVFTGSGNTYIVLENGKIISSRWWKLTDEERTEIQAVENTSPKQGFIALNKGNAGVMYSGLDGEEVAQVIMMDIVDKGAYWCFLNDQAVTEVKSHGAGEIQKYQWYRSAHGSDYNFIEYNGESPISMSDFTEEQIYSQSYLQKIIDSFS